MAVVGGPFWLVVTKKWPRLSATYPKQPTCCASARCPCHSLEEEDLEVTPNRLLPSPSPHHSSTFPLLYHRCRTEEEDVEVTPDAKDLLTKIGVETSLR